MPNPVINRRSQGNALYALDPLISVWVNAITSRGGNVPSQIELIATSKFVQGMINSGLWSKMKIINTFPNAGHITGTIPLLANFGSIRWNENAVAPWVDADFSVLGVIAGASSGKCFFTGMNGTDFASDTSVGFTAYLSQTPITAGTYLCGYGNNSGSDTVGLNANNNNFGNPTNFFSWNSSTSAVGSVALTAGGYLSGNRTASNATALYYANSTTPHAALATGSGSGGSRSANTITLCGLNAYEIPSNPFTTFPTGISFFATHDGLTSADSAIFYSLVQQYLVNKGGGYV